MINGFIQFCLGALAGIIAYIIANAMGAPILVKCISTPVKAKKIKTVRVGAQDAEQAAEPVVAATSPRGRGRPRKAVPMQSARATAIAPSAGG